MISAICWRGISACIYEILILTGTNDIAAKSINKETKRYLYAYFKKHIWTQKKIELDVLKSKHVYFWCKNDHLCCASGNKYTNTQNVQEHVILCFCLCAVVLSVTSGNIEGINWGNEAVFLCTLLLLLAILHTITFTATGHFANITLHTTSTTTTTTTTAATVLPWIAHIATLNILSQHNVSLHTPYCVLFYTHYPINP